MFGFSDYTESGMVFPQNQAARGQSPVSASGVKCHGPKWGGGLALVRLGTCPADAKPVWDPLSMEITGSSPPPGEEDGAT